MKPLAYTAFLLIFCLFTFLGMLLKHELRLIYLAFTISMALFVLWRIEKSGMP